MNEANLRIQNLRLAETILIWKILAVASWQGYWIQKLVVAFRWKQDSEFQLAELYTHPLSTVSGG